MSNRRQFIKQSALAGLGVTAALESENLFINDPSANAPFAKGSFKQINFVTSKNPDELTVNGIRIARRVLFNRTGIDSSQKHERPLNVHLNVVQKAMVSGAFEIAHLTANHIVISATDSNGLLYGVGKLLHTGITSPDGFTPGNWQGTSTPEKPFRMIYFATHFHNFYHDAPIEKVTEYIEELVLWGYNAISVWFDMHHYEGIKSREAQAMLDRLAQILRAGKRSGMKTMLTALGNEGYNSTPPELRATTPLQIKLRGKYGVEICPSQPGGPELILKHFDEEFDEFKARGVSPDYFSLWPYDQGGCGCDQCTPWGSNGYLKMTKLITALARKKLPEIKVIMSTWLFDVVEDEGEWAGLAEAFKKETPWVDYIMADSHETFPKYLFSHPVPGNLPLLNFPEISMWESWPWGGFGANPLPARFQKLWSSVSGRVSGGYPYSEGLFEDMNKVIYSQFYWTANKPVMDAVREYVSYEFSAEHADQILEAIEIMEKNHGLSTYTGKGSKDMERKFTVPKNDHGAARAYALLSEVNEKMGPKTKSAWRWRILLLRAMFDHELRLTGGVPNQKIIAGFKELSQLYFANNAEPSVRPPLT